MQWRYFTVIFLCSCEDRGVAVVDLKHQKCFLRDPENQESDAGKENFSGGSLRLRTQMFTSIIPPSSHQTALHRGV